MELKRKREDRSANRARLRLLGVEEPVLLTLDIRVLTLAVAAAAAALLGHSDRDSGCSTAAGAHSEGSAPGGRAAGAVETHILRRAASGAGKR